MLKDPATRHGATRRGALIWGLAGLVHCTWPVSTCLAQAKRGEAKGKRPAKEPPAVIVGRGGEGLPPAVADMRSAIIAAIESGDIAELKGAMELNELPPEIGALPGSDPIQHLRSLSADGTGKDVLAQIARLLEGTWAAIPGGRDVENNRIYVWPQFAELPLDRLGEAERAALTALSGEEKAQRMIREQRYRGWRLSIGADGVWHMLTQVQ